jgi:hypothetical protein
MGLMKGGRALSIGILQKSSNYAWLMRGVLAQGRFAPYSPRGLVLVLILCRYPSVPSLLSLGGYARTDRGRCRYAVVVIPVD